MKRMLIASLLVASALLVACRSSDSNNKQAAQPVPAEKTPKNVIFFLGDGMGINTLTASRIYAVGEEGELTIDTMPETGFIKTYSNDSQVTDSAPSMSAYMTGVKMNNEVISMSSDTKAIEPDMKAFTSKCGAANGTPAQTFLELAKAAGWGTGVVTTTRVTHATPAATYAHACHRDAEADIAAQLVPGGQGFNSKLGDGVDIVLGGGKQYFVPAEAGGKRQDKRDLTAELKAKGYAVALSRSEFDAIDPAKAGKVLGLFANSHLSYDLDRDSSKEPSLAEMTVKAITTLKKNKAGFFLMVEGGRIDHALHETVAKKALQDTVAFDNAIKAAIDEMKKTDPELKNTLIVVTADHDHTLVLNGYGKRTGKTTATNPGILGLMRDYSDGSVAKDSDGKPFTVLGFGNGHNRVPGNRNSAGDLTDDIVSANTYAQEAAIRIGKDQGSETHGGTDVFIGAMGMGADQFSGFMDNTQVFGLLRSAAGL
ncbi:alkaline phosphatase [Chitinivorax tropicus]|uniref:Alkaline phosphatase n=1 Tax=Chitinivorax tropicus TaxID=714531 RepID=A0A840MS63_9PROT|nr:alkaline phosphatase [Chitinivorax tropicus]MBB5019113.1 alkaline phosphatase [Chitinivorax tropicus]